MPLSHLAQAASPETYSSLLGQLSDAEKRKRAIDFLISGASAAQLVKASAGKGPAAIESRADLACVLLMIKQGAPGDLATSDPDHHVQIQARIQQLREAGWG